LAFRGWQLATVPGLFAFKQTLDIEVLHFVYKIVQRRIDKDLRVSRIDGLLKARGFCWNCSLLVRTSLLLTNAR
jgi:hypothetical protein